MKEIKVKKTFGPLVCTLIRQEHGHILARINCPKDNAYGWVDTPLNFAEIGVQEHDVPALAEGLLWLRDTMSKLKVLGEAESKTTDVICSVFTKLGQQDGEQSQPNRQNNN
jgi:hypothetical protein